MNKKFVEKCAKIFESRNVKKIDLEKLNMYKKLIGFKIVPELIYIFENYEGVMLKEGYGFVPKEPSPLTNEKGYETFIEFIGLDTKYNLFTIYEMYKQQLPLGIFPIAEMDGGNYLCISDNGYIYIWLHDCIENESLFLANTSISKFILSVEKMPEVDIDISQIESKYSDGFWD